MDWPQNRPKRYQTVARQTNGDKKLEANQQRKGTKIVPGGHLIFIQKQRQSLRPNGQPKATLKERHGLDMDGRTHPDLRKSRTENHGNTVFGTLQFGIPKYNNRRQHKRPRATLWQEQPDGKLKPIGFASRFFSDTKKNYAINELELLAVVWGLEHFRLYIYGKPIKLLTDHQALEPLIKRNRSNKTNSARLTRWLDRLAHFTINVNHIAGKPLAPTDSLSRNPSIPPQTDEAYDEKYVINNIMPHYKFISLTP